jgi:hypothetical protein
MPNVSATSLISLLAIRLVAAEPTDVREQALRVLRLRYLDVHWQLTRPIVAELTGDGEPDLVVEGRRDGGFALGVIVGPVRPSSMMLSIVWPPFVVTDSANCEKGVGPAVATESPTLPQGLWGCSKQEGPAEFCASVRQLDSWMRDAAGKGMQALRVSGVTCTELHLYWSPHSKRFDQWQAE